MENQAAGSYLQLVFFVVLLAAFYVLIIRPYKAKAQAHESMVATLKVGDKVVTIGGIHGTIKGMLENTVEIEVAPETVLTFNKSAVGAVVTPE